MYQTTRIYKSAVCSFVPSFIQDPPPSSPPSPLPPSHVSFLSRSLSLVTHTRMHTHTDTHFPSLWCILVSGVLCFSSQGREESGPGSKLTINSTLPEPGTRSNTSTPSLLLLLLPLYSSYLSSPPFSPLPITGTLSCRILVYSFFCLCVFSPTFICFLHF